MRKTLLKIALVATLSLPIFPGWSQAVSMFKNAWSPNVQHNPEYKCKDKNYSHYLGLQRDENLKAYHLGLKALFPKYRIPSSEDLLKMIRSHSHFMGLQTQSEALKQWENFDKPFFIFEEKDRNKPHFYLAYSGGLRHFTVKGLPIAGLDNGAVFCCPYVEHLIQSTLTS